ncbi:cytoplasmic asparaginase I [Buchnera aphidicola (Aphis glycines)]|uniref:L-asparaginase 1 n=1 Tax=Buchnera aphidicola (Aphis glycines) TaxID=1265350 RepID=A0A0M4H4W2_9GAMM|nr:asparaginase [Buchnera aphidicola]ALD15468.1 cytoplasmic asparaginase I [Buchnera aphidicola (Aphis glycines)]
MTKKNIYIAYTGGTIGMKKSNNGYIPIAGYFKKKLTKMPEFYSPEIPNFIIKEYNPLIDSANMSPIEWQKIANDIKKKYYQYDGFIVIHGTDTMAYTASALSFILENLKKPIIITGSQIPIATIRSDGRQNLLNSLLIIANYPIHEVTVFFNNKLYRGNRTTKSNANGFNAFSSPNIAPLLEMGINIHYLCKNKFYKKQKKLKVYKIIPQPISIISIYPGISSEILKNFLLHPVKALILCTYGVGNAPQNKKFLNELYIAHKKNIIIINLTQCASGHVNMNGYATGNTLKKIGVISGYDLTIEAAVTKLHFLLSQEISVKKVRRQMQNNLRGELTNYL